MGATELGLPAGEFLVLQDLFLNGQSPINAITTRTGLAQSRVSTAVRTLSERGWTTTSPDPADGRKTLVDLTEATRTAGTERRRSAAQTSLTNALAGAADDHERDQLITALARLHQLLLADQAPRRFPTPK